MTYKVFYDPRALKDLKRVKAAGLVESFRRVEAQLKADPFAPTQKFEHLTPYSMGLHSRRVDRKNRVVYSVDVDSQAVTVYSAYGHYER